MSTFTKHYPSGPGKSTPSDASHHVAALFFAMMVIALLLLAGFYYSHYVKDPYSVYAPNTGGNAHYPSREVSPFYRAGLDSVLTTNLHAT